MKIIEFEQGSEDWLNWRQHGNSASNAPAIMGEGHFFPKTPYQLYQVMTGEKEIFYNQAMKDGHKFESVALDLVNQLTSFNLKPACGQKGEYLASFDGLEQGEDGSFKVCEIKTTTFESEIWERGDEIYYWQLAHQALVAGTDVVVLATYAKDTGELKLTQVKIPDEDKYKLLKAWDKFNSYVLNFEPPPKIPGKDYVDNESEDWEILAESYKELKKLKKQTEERLKEVTSQLIDLADGQNTKGCGISVYEVERKGSIDYSSIEALKGVNLDDYRKPATKYWVIK